MGVYAWLITVDHDPTEGAKPGTNGNAVGMEGPRNAAPELLAQLAAGEGRVFRIYDDDENICYEGRIIADPGSEDDFAPLDDFGQPNAGCTYIEYKNAAGEWKML